jgi:hypothetical protein
VPKLAVIGDFAVLDVGLVDRLHPYRLRFAKVSYPTFGHNDFVQLGAQGAAGLFGEAGAHLACIGKLVAVPAAQIEGSYGSCRGNKADDRQRFAFDAFDLDPTARPAGSVESIPVLGDNAL